MPTVPAFELRAWIPLLSILHPRHRRAQTVCRQCRRPDRYPGLYFALSRLCVASLYLPTHQPHLYKCSRGHARSMQCNFFLERLHKIDTNYPRQPIRYGRSRIRQRVLDNNLPAPRPDEFCSKATIHSCPVLCLPEHQGPADPGLAYTYTARSALFPAPDYVRWVPDK